MSVTCVLVWDPLPWRLSPPLACFPKRSKPHVLPEFSGIHDSRRETVTDRASWTLYTNNALPKKNFAYTLKRNLQPLRVKTNCSPDLTFKRNLSELKLNVP
eukprot:765673-Hanusia_phi.AAC.1